MQDLTSETARQLNLPANQQGVVIDRVEPGSLAEESGLHQGDIIIELNRKSAKNTRDYEQVVSRIKKDETVLLLIKRQGGTIFVTISP